MYSMRKRFIIFAALLFVVGTMLSCSKDETAPPSSGEMPVGGAYITDSVRYEANHMTAYNFVYPSTDPYGNPVMLSGTITMGDNVKSNAYAKGLLLYNHFTIYRADQCPSKGGLTEQKYTASMDLITVSPDYYGFGITEDRNQAYCVSQTNAQASVDALLAAEAILAAKGFTWGDKLFNAGYSQGGQTAMGVVRLVAERYPDIHITYTFAGAGSYDISETYRQFVNPTIASMPSTVVSVMLSYNEFKNLGIPREQLFVEPVLSHIDDWFLSKRYTRQQIDSLIGSLTLAQYATQTVLDTTSDISRQMMSALDLDNICQGWTPRGDERIMLFHSSKDITVPVANTQNMYNFLSGKVQEVNLQIQDIEATETLPAHEKAAETFMLVAAFKLMELL